MTWHKDSPRLWISSENIERVNFYARLETILREYFERDGRKRLFPVAIDEDRWRLGGYYVMDWVLQSEGEPFTATELLREQETDFDPLLRISLRNVERLLDHLAGHEILEVVREDRRSMTIIGDVVESRSRVYRLAGEIRRSLYGFAAQNESERASREVSLVGPTLSRPDPTPEQAPSARVLGGHYELLDLIGQGGMGSVYRGRDRLTGRSVAVKVPLAAINDNPHAAARLRREADIAMRLRHPQIVEAYEVISVPDNGTALVMELLTGPTLQKQVASHGLMRPVQVAAIGHRLAGALGYLASERVVRVDLKPANVIMQGDRGPVIVDLGVAKGLESSAYLTNTGAIVGTPMYMAPEQIQGLHPDARADLFSLGMVMYYCLAGRNPWEHLENMVEIMYAIVHSHVDVSGLAISQEFKQVLARTLARRPDDRFQAAAEVQQALEAIPEWPQESAIQDDFHWGSVAKYRAAAVQDSPAGQPTVQYSQVPLIKPNLQNEDLNTTVHVDPK